MTSIAHPQIAAARRRTLENQILPFLLFWAAEMMFSFYLLLEAVEVGGTMSWIALLHPILTWLTFWPLFHGFLLGRNWLTLPNIVLLSIYLRTVLGSAYYLLKFDQIPPDLQLPDLAAQGMLVILVGVVAFRLGAEGPWLKGVVRKLPSMPTAGAWSPRIRAGVCGALLVKLALDLYLDFRGMWGYGTTQIQDAGVFGLFHLFSAFGRIGLTVGFFYWFSSRSFPARDKYLLGVAAGLFLAVALLSASKTNTIILMIMAFIPYQLLKTAKATRVRIPLALKLTATGLVLLLFLWNHGYRKGLLEARPENMAERTAVALERADQFYETEMQEANLAESAIEEVWRRFSIFPLLLTALDQTPSRIDFRRWDRYYLLPLLVTVPRIFWPDKPMLSGLEFKRLYMNPEATDSAGPGFFGYAYLEHGFFGVIVVMLFMGLTVRFFQLYSVWKHGLTPASVSMFAAFALYFALIGDPIGLWAGLVRMLIPFVVAYYAIFAFAKPAESRTPIARWR